MAGDGIKIVKKALEKGFASKGAKVFSFAEKSDYKNFIRLFVISDFFRRKSEKERLGEVLSMLEKNGAKSVMTRISLCVVMTKREYEKEFGRGVFLGVGLHKTSPVRKTRPKLHRLAQVRATKQSL
jgi:hypothetical protein